jgi:predicted nucleic acid-binding protein
LIFVVDACAALEYLLRTRLGLRVEALIDDAALSAPELLDAEVLAVLRRHVLAGRLGEERAAEAIADLADWDVERISHRELVDVAWALRANVTAHDALYVAAARIRGGALLTADGPLARAPRLGVVVHDVRLG